MATRAEVLSFLRGFSDAEEYGEGDFRITYELDNGRSQLLLLHVSDDVLVMSSPFAHLDDITSAKALSLQTLFGVVLAGDFYCLRHVLFLAELDEEEVLQGGAFLAHQADDLELDLGADKF